MQLKLETRLLHCTTYLLPVFVKLCWHTIPCRSSKWHGGVEADGRESGGWLKLQLHLLNWNWTICQFKFKLALCGLIITLDLEHNNNNRNEVKMSINVLFCYFDLMKVMCTAIGIDRDPRMGWWIQSYPTHTTCMHCFNINLITSGNADIKPGLQDIPKPPSLQTPILMIICRSHCPALIVSLLVDWLTETQGWNDEHKITHHCVCAPI